MNVQEFQYRLYLIRGPLTILASLLLVAALVYFFTGVRRESVDVGIAPSAPLGEKIRTGDVPAPTYTAETAAKLERGPVFHALASYTDNGFEPARIRIKRGQTVRFTNNSSKDVWIASSGTSVAIYPRTREVCGSSDLDSCEPFRPQDFWQFRFDVAGEWEVVNNLDKAKNATVIVE